MIQLLTFISLFWLGSQDPNIESKLTGGSNRKTWVLDARYDLDTRNCIRKEMTFALGDHSFEMKSCNGGATQGSWQIEGTADGDYRITLKSPQLYATYFVDIFSGKSGEVLRLRIKGTTLQSETTDLIYNAR